MKELAKAHPNIEVSHRQGGKPSLHSVVFTPGGPHYCLAITIASSTNPHDHFPFQVVEPVVDEDVLLRPMALMLAPPSPPRPRPLPGGGARC